MCVYMEAALSYPAGELEVGGWIGGGAIDTDGGGSNIHVYIYIYMR